MRAQDLDHLSPEAGAELLRARGAKGADEELRAAAREYDGHGFALTLLGSYLRGRRRGGRAAARGHPAAGRTSGKAGMRAG